MGWDIFRLIRVVSLETIIFYLFLTIKGHVSNDKRSWADGT